MCGIAGFYSKNPEYNKAEIVQDMLRRMAYRGPDQTGVAVFEHCAMGMVRLSIVSQEEHEIPLKTLDGKMCIVYNGEIYNSRELRRGFAGKYDFCTQSDTEVALAYYYHQGLDSLQRHNGMYAFAIWDEREGELVLVRDRFGEKPLYYVEGKDFFAYASEMKCLLGLVKPEFNDTALSYKAYEFTFGRETLFKNIHSIEPGHYLRFRDCSARTGCYWRLWERRREVPEDPKRLREELKELLVDSILLRTENCVHNFSVFVSGGVDSSLVSCIAKPDRLYTCHYDMGEDFDELQYAKMVARHIKRDLIIVEPQPVDFERTEKQIIFHLDTPCTWTSFSWWMLLERAHADGVKVVMTGDGADETWGGYHRYLLLYNDEQIHKLQAMKQYEYLMQRYYGSPVERYAKLVNRYEDNFNQEITEFLREKINDCFQHYPAEVIHGMGASDMMTTMQVLLQMSDRMSMAFSIENRSPFLDYRLIEYLFSMPESMKINFGVPKWLLKEIAREFIPEQIVNRTDKRGFSAPFNRWFGLDIFGKYDRSLYRKRTLKAWRKVFNV